MDAAVPGDRLLEGTLKRLLGPGSCPFAALALRELEGACRASILEMLSQYPQSAFQGFVGVTREGQQQFATQSPPRPFCSV